MNNQESNNSNTNTPPPPPQGTTEWRIQITRGRGRGAIYATIAGQIQATLAAQAQMVGRGQVRGRRAAPSTSSPPVTSATSTFGLRPAVLVLPSERTPAQSGSGIILPPRQASPPPLSPRREAISDTDSDQENAVANMLVELERDGVVPSTGGAVESRGPPQYRTVSTETPRGGIQVRVLPEWMTRRREVIRHPIRNPPLNDSDSDEEMEGVQPVEPPSSPSLISPPETARGGGQGPNTERIHNPYHFYERVPPSAISICHRCSVDMHTCGNVEIPTTHGIRHMVSLVSTVLDSNKELEEGSLSVSLIYTRYDMPQLAAIVGSERASRMLSSDRAVHMFMTGE